jgi:hypothetical protein
MVRTMDYVKKTFSLQSIHVFFTEKTTLVIFRCERFRKTRCDKAQSVELRGPKKTWCRIFSSSTIVQH